MIFLFTYPGPEETIGTGFFLFSNWNWKPKNHCAVDDSSAKTGLKINLTASFIVIRLILKFMYPWVMLLKQWTLLYYSNACMMRWMQWRTAWCTWMILVFIVLIPRKLVYQSKLLFQYFLDKNQQYLLLYHHVWIVTLLLKLLLWVSNLCIVIKLVHSRTHLLTNANNHFQNCVVGSSHFSVFSSFVFSQFDIVPRREWQLSYQWQPSKPITLHSS